MWELEESQEIDCLFLLKMQKKTCEKTALVPAQGRRVGGEGVSVLQREQMVAGEARWGRERAVHGAARLSVLLGFALCQSDSGCQEKSLYCYLHLRVFSPVRTNPS